MHALEEVLYSLNRITFYSYAFKTFYFTFLNFKQFIFQGKGMQIMMS